MKNLFTAVVFAACFTTAAIAADSGGYAHTPMTMENIGKSYMGRDIAYVMGHEGAGWLERPEREREEGTDKLLPLLGLKPTDTVADIGAGTGYFSFRLAAGVPQGKVYAEDVQEAMVDEIKERIAQRGIKNVEPVLGGIQSPKLPKAKVDLILLVDAYHEFSYPREMGLAMVEALKPGGRIALVEYRGEDDSVPIKDLHKMTVAQAAREMNAIGLSLVSVDSRTLPWQHLMIFQKPASDR